VKGRTNRKKKEKRKKKKKKISGLVRREKKARGDTRPLPGTSRPVEKKEKRESVVFFPSKKKKSERGPDLARLPDPGRRKEKKGGKKKEQASGLKRKGRGGENRGTQVVDTEDSRGQRKRKRGKDPTVLNETKKKKETRLLTVYLVRCMSGKGGGGEDQRVH